MTNLDDLKDALSTPPDFAAQPIDLAAVMAAGGRVRRRRRLAVGSASGVAVLALLVGGAQVAGRVGPGGPQGATGAAEPAWGPSPSASAPPADRMLGDIVHTDVSTSGVEWLLYAKAIDDKRLPKIHFGLMLGRRSADDTLEDAVMANEVTGSDRSPGFHAVQGSMNVNGRQTLTFGYYVGPAEKITGKAHGKKVTAGLATWSEDSSVHFFWFAPAASQIASLTALGKDGKRLPAGDNKIGVG